MKQEVLEEGTIVTADYQEGGRGMGEHSWLSNRGENLLMSVLLLPAFLSASKQFHLSRVVSLALCDVLGTMGIDPRIKWPNDILTRNRKIAGILIENGITAGHISRSIVGIGLNLNQTAFPVFDVPASSLLLETGQFVDVNEIGGQVAEGLKNRYYELKMGHIEQLEKQYEERLYRAGISSVFRSGEDSFEGYIRGVNEFGELMVESGGRIRTFGYGSISMLP
jgi:BirA family biotin operon repressor/biotin-[acetyl-CoA-carboxylase] ligase